MTAPLWEDRGHAARIRAAAHDLGLIVWIQPGFKMHVRHPDGRTLMTAKFSPRGQINRGSVHTLTDTRHMFAETWITPAEAAGGVVQWLKAGAPMRWSFNPIGYLRDDADPTPPTGDGLAPVIPLRPRTP